MSDLVRAEQRKQILRRNLAEAMSILGQLKGQHA
jgi:hypothetical protein